jgi:hypothetical protein
MGDPTMNRAHGRLCAAAHFVAELAGALQRTALLWLVWVLGYSTLWLGAVAAAELLAGLLMGALAARLAARLGALRLLRFAQLLALVPGLSLAVLSDAGIANLPIALSLALASGVIDALAAPGWRGMARPTARAAPERAYLGEALLDNGARFLGPALAGLVIDRGGLALAFAAAAVVRLPVAAALLLLKPSALAGAPRRESGDTLAACRYAVAHRGFRQMILLLSLSGFGLGGVAALYPGFADLFGGGALLYGWLAASFGLGALAGSLLLLRRFGIAGLAALVLGHSGLAALAVLGLAATASYGVAVFAAFIAGFSLAAAALGGEMLIASAAEPARRAALLALARLTFRGAAAASALALGALAMLIGLRLAVAAGGLLALAAWLWARLVRPSLAEVLAAEARGAAR